MSPILGENDSGSYGRVAKPTYPDLWQEQREGSYSSAPWIISPPTYRARWSPLNLSPRPSVREVLLELRPQITEDLPRVVGDASGRGSQGGASDRVG
jgi:hypothetical protein